MQYLGAGVLFIVGLGISFMQAPSVSAGRLSASGEITITARVVPAHYVIVNEQHEIIEITSNTAEKVTPRVFLSKVAAGSETALTQDVLRQYNVLIPREGKIGTLYKKPVPAASVSRPAYLLPVRAEAFNLIRYLY